MSPIIEPHFINDVILSFEHVFIAVIRTIFDLNYMFVEYCPFSFALGVKKLFMNILNFLLVLGCSILEVDTFEFMGRDFRKGCRLDLLEKVLDCLLFIL